MFGSVRPDGRCRICKKRFSRDNFDPLRATFFCREHPNETCSGFVLTAGNQYYFKKGEFSKLLLKRAQIHEEREQEKANGTYSAAKYKQASQLKLENLIEPYIKERHKLVDHPDRTQRLTHNTWQNEAKWLRAICKKLGGESIVKINYSMWCKVFNSEFGHLSPKSKNDRKSPINGLYRYLVEAGTILPKDVPDLPTFTRPRKSKALNARKTFKDLSQRDLYLHMAGIMFTDNDPDICLPQAKEPKDPKLFLYLHMLSTYGYRVEESLELLENKDKINLSVTGEEHLLIWDDKVKEEKPINLDPVHVAAIKAHFAVTGRQVGRHFFRYPEGHSNAGKRYGKDHPYRSWQRVYKSLLEMWGFWCFVLPVTIEDCPIERITVCPASRHYAATNASEAFSTEDIALSTGHKNTDTLRTHYIDKPRAVHAFNLPRSTNHFLYVPIRDSEPTPSAPKVRKLLRIN